MLEDKSRFLEEMASKLEPCMAQGYQSGRVMLTPKSVKTLLKIPITSARAELDVDMIRGSKKSMHQSTWLDSTGKKTDLYVYASGIKFPDVCPVTMETADHIEVVEVAVPKRTIRAEFKERNQDKVNRMHTAMTCDRYWMAIPFSGQHGARDKSTSIELMVLGNGVYSTKFLFSNRAYAREFSKLNWNEGGKWCLGGSNLMGTVGYWGIFLSACGLVGAFLPVIFVKNKTVDSMPSIIGIIAVLLAMLIGSIFLRRKAKTAEEAL